MMARSRTLDEFTKPTGTIIGEGFTIKTANFTCDDSETLRIDGTIIGNIDIKGVLNISETGCVEGNVNASFVRVAGTVNGNIFCRNAVHLTSTADVSGDVSTATIIIDDGAAILGSCKTIMPVDSEVIGISMDTIQG